MNISVKFNTLGIVCQYLAYRNPNLIISNDLIDTIIVSIKEIPGVTKYQVKLVLPDAWKYEDGYIIIGKGSRYEEKFELICLTI